MARYLTTGTKSTIGAINTELEKIAVSQEDFLSRRGETPNQMEADLDMNSNDILNLPEPRFSTSPVRLQDLTNLSDSVGAFKLYDTVASLVEENLLPSSVVYTRGYYSEGDGGGGEYTVVAVDSYTGNYLESADIALSNGNIAVLSKYSKVNVLQWGAKPDLTTDNVQQFREALRYLKTFTSGGELYIPQAGTGYLTSPLDLSNASNIVITGNYPIVKYDNRVQGDYILAMTSCYNITIEKINFVGVSDADAVYDTLNRRAGIETTLSSFILIQECIFEKFNSFGIFAQRMNGGTYTEGLRILNNTFKDFTYDAATEVQAGVILSYDAEYSTVAYNNFYRIPSAVRGDDGANSIVHNNIIMQLNSEWRTDAAAIYFEYDPLYNGGKVQVTNNKLNHIESGQIAIFLKGDPAKPQNPFIVEGNEILVTGDVTHSQLIVINDAPNSRILNNSLRPFAVVAGDASIRLNRCDNTIIENNYIRGGDYSITLSDSTAFLGKNIYDTPTSGKVQRLGTGLPEYVGRTTSSFRIATAGTLGIPADDPTVTSSLEATGQYRLTHNFGNTNYSVNCTQDALTSANIIYSVVRTSTTIDIYLKDASGVAVNSNTLVTVTHGTDSEYIL